MFLSDNNHLKVFLGQHKNVYNVYKRSVDSGNFLKLKFAVFAVVVAVVVVGKTEN